MMIDTSEDAVAARCHANCIEAAITSARRVPDAGEIVERGGILLYATASDFPSLANGAFRLDPRVPADRVIDAADAWFAERGRGWSLGTTSWADGDRDLIEAATARGLVAAVDMPGMVCDERLPDAIPPDGVELRVVSGGSDAAAFVAMIDQAYTSLGLPAGVLAALAGDAATMIPPCHEVTVGAFENGAFLSGAQVLFSHGIAGVYAVGTAESGRGRGLAELVTRAVTNLGFDGGAPLVTLQASPMGESIYRRMGYREIYRYVNHTRFA
jgi:hypothetical protein